MKIVGRLLASLALGTVLSPAAMAYTVSGTDVGSTDVFIDELNSSSPCQAVGGSESGGGAAAEICWINAVAGESFGVADYEKIEGMPYYYVDGSSSIFAFELPDSPEYFLIKNATWRALFSNVAALNWGVVDSGDLDSGFNIGLFCTVETPCFLSHIGYVGNGTEVPEPETLALLGLGLIGLGAMRRRRG